MTPDELSPSKAARRIGTSTRTVQRWIAVGRLPARRVGGRWRVAIDALDALDAFDTTNTTVDARSSPVAGRPTLGAPPRPRRIRHLFVANRGEIARRIERTCRRLGTTVTIPATVGHDALNLLDIAATIEAATRSGADAVHPGFGFLAENADFAVAVAAAGLVWVGPPPEAIRAMGDKAAARRLAARLGVPTVPGYDDADQADARIAAAAAGIGFPLLVKPAAGGGGKGMRIVRAPDQLGDAVASARREAAAAFGDDRLILERLVEGARHVEVQVLFDGLGAGVHLGERDCSIQRRHQKVLEESPSPAVSDELRERLGAHAVRLAGAVGYVGAGTCEFLLTDRGEVFFLEMNTRLQVEHPVTELVTGRDLVEDQLRIAAGEVLGFGQAEADEARRAGGHAIEVRLYAEDAEDGFLPATGRIEALAWPSGPGVRVDAGVDAGDEVTGRFDPMLAKVIAHGPDRPAALERLAAALNATVVLGITTNLRFLRWLVAEPVVRDGQARIDVLDRIWPPDDWAERTAIPSRAWDAAAAILGGGWRLNAPARVRLVTDDGSEQVRAVPTDPATLAALAALPTVAVGEGPDRIVHVDVDGRSVAVRRALPPDVDRAVQAAASHHAGGPIEVTAPMPGGIVAVHAAVGSSVAAGDPLVTLEAMKMEHVVVAPASGTVVELAAQRADQVSRGDVLAVIEP